MKVFAGVLFSILLPAVAAAADFPADRIVAAASGDWNRDGAMDLAIIARPAEDSGDDNGLYVYLADATASRLELVLSLPNSVWGGLTLYGQEPELAALSNGSFTLSTKNDAVGRDRWRQTLTIAYRNTDFIVAGYTFSGYDTLGPDSAGRECDLNVLTGKGKMNGRPVAGKPSFALLRTWKDSDGQTACGLGE